MATSTSPPPARQRYARGEGDKLRVDLLESAAELMARHGSIEGISLRSVARHAGVSPTAVYRHFDDHLDLLRESVEHCWSRFRDVIQNGRDSSPDPFEAFRNTGDAYVRFALEHPGQYRVMFSNEIDLALDCDGMDPSSIGMSAFQILVDLVSAMLDERGDHRDPFFVSVQVHTWIHGIVGLCGANPDAPWPPVSALLDGLQEALRLQPKPAT